MTTEVRVGAMLAPVSHFMPVGARTMTPRRLTRLPSSVYTLAIPIGLLTVSLLLAGATAAHAYVCGNGVVEPGEACDDGNGLSGDGCSSACEFEECSVTGTWEGSLGTNLLFTLSIREDSGGSLSGAAVLQGFSFPVMRLTGLRQGRDVSFSLAFDTSFLTFSGYESSCDAIQVIGPYGTGGMSRTGPFRCTDGITDPGEECDDGNFDAGDGCSLTCRVERCGNGEISAAERCDDGNRVNGDGCDSNCTPSACGNSIVAPNEQCDDGNVTDGDGCDSHCGIPGCPNGTREGGEECDDGNLIDNDGCARNCRLPGCGNFVTEGGEQCDDGGVLPGDGCDGTCRFEAVPGCGDGTEDAPEECDDGNTASCDGCSAVCTLEQCGNGIAECAEDCDDGNRGNGDGCSARCRAEYPLCGDEDADGVPDHLDRCATTPLALSPDESGCSQEQFCRQVDASTRLGMRACRKADWRNDEPLMRGSERDCQVVRDDAGVRCEPAVP